GLAQVGRGQEERVAVLAQGGVEEGREGGVLLQGAGEVGRDATEDLEGLARRLVDALPAQDEGAHGLGVVRELVQEARLAAARLGLQEDEPALAAAGAREAGLQRGELARA